MNRHPPFLAGGARRERPRAVKLPNIGEPPGPRALLSLSTLVGILAVSHLLAALAGYWAVLLSGACR